MTALGALSDRSPARVKVVFIGGYSRSGSTLLSRALGEAPGSICVGETRFLWSRGLIDNVQCGCGVPFRSCEFWRSVGEHAFGGWDRVDAPAMAAIDWRTNRYLSLPVHLFPRLRPGIGGALAHYAGQLALLYDAIARVSGACTIIDTSKDPTFASLLMRVENVDLRVVHLVRDSRAVAYSWTRRRRLVSPIAGEEFMPRYAPASTAGKWLAWNIACQLLSLAPAPFLSLTYERFVASPRRVLEELSGFAGVDLTLSDSQLDDRSVALGDHHIFSGNPMRTRTGRLAIQLDTEWRSAMPSRQRLSATAISWPLLLRYGYGLRTSKGAEASAVAHDPARRS
jgi:hypothetical protein